MTTRDELIQTLDAAYQDYRSAIGGLDERQFDTKWLDGRIDDPNAGWKGRGLWSTVSTRTPFHMETGKGTPPIVMHVQVRPDPLAK